MEKPSERIRTTLAEVPRVAGVYILAYMNKILYVGKSEDSVYARLRTHVTPAAGKLLIDDWLQSVGMQDEENVRLDVLVPPADAGAGWFRQVEEACIRRFRPLLNVASQA